MPYRIDLPHPLEGAFDTLVDLGALDVEAGQQGLAALMPDSVSSAAVAIRLGVADVSVSPAVGRDDDSVWTLRPRPIRVSTFLITPAGRPAPPDALVLADGPAFGTGLHPTTALCLEAIDALLTEAVPARMLDVGTGSGILALAALRRGVGSAIGLDVDRAALRVAAGNARVNDLADRFFPVCGSADVVAGAWPLVTANIRAAELIELAPLLVRRLASRGALVLSGIPQSVAADVSRTYRHLGLTASTTPAREGWTALVFRTSW